MSSTTAAYQHTLAHLYDQLKAGDNYQKWADLLLEPIHRFGNGGRRLLDVGCGTGSSSLAFADRSFHVTGCDLSADMLAAARTRDHTGAIEFLHADMRALPAHLSDFDVVLWMDDVANHLLNPNDLQAALHASAAALTPGGLLLFDVNSLAAFRAGFTGCTITESPTNVFAWIGETRPDGPPEHQQWTARILAFQQRPDGAWGRTDGTVTERYFAPETVQELITTAGLKHLATYGLHAGQLHTDADDHTHNKLVYVAQRP